MDLIIKVLKYIEENNTATNNIVVEIQGYESEEERELVQYQVKILRDAGYIEAKEVAKKKGLDFLSLPFELTKALLVEVTKRTLLG